MEDQKLRAIEALMRLNKEGSAGDIMYVYRMIEDECIMLRDPLKKCYKNEFLHDIKRMVGVIEALRDIPTFACMQQLRGIDVAAFFEKIRRLQGQYVVRDSPSLSSLTYITNLGSYAMYLREKLPGDVPIEDCNRFLQACILYLRDRKLMQEW